MLKNGLGIETIGCAGLIHKKWFGPLDYKSENYTKRDSPKRFADPAKIVIGSANILADSAENFAGSANILADTTETKFGRLCLLNAKI